MAKYKRHKTAYLGVYYIEGTHVATGKPEKIFYIRYRRDGKMVEEKAGRQDQDDMTAPKASRLRGRRIDGDQPSNAGKRAAAQEAKDADAHKWTLKRLWAEYKRQNPSLKGLPSDKSRFDNYLSPTLGDKEPTEILTLDVDRVRLRLLKKKSPQTVKLALALLKRLINFGVKKGLCYLPDPAKLNIELPKVNNLRTEDLTADQLKDLFNALDEDPNVAVANLMKLALFTGMRRGELFRLEWSHIDFEKNFIRLEDPKGGVDQTIPLNAAARKVLEGHARQNSAYVFPGRRGGQRKDIRHPVERIKKKAKLPKSFRPLHGLRHVYASMLASSGKVDMYTLQKLLTHKSPAMTQRYAHLRDEALERASGVAGDIFDKVVNDSRSSE